MRNFIATASSLTLMFCFISHAAHGMGPEGLPEEVTEKVRIVREANLRLRVVEQEPDSQFKCIMQPARSPSAEECLSMKDLMLFPDGVDLAFLPSCSQLTRLNIQAGEIPCDSLSSLTTLTELSVGGNWDFAEALPHLTNLNCLTIGNSESLKLSDDLTSLTKLSASKSLLSSETLRHFPKLSSLWVGNCCTFEGPLSLPNLKELGVSAGGLPSFIVENFTGLRTLRVSDPENCERFSCLTNITELSFDGTSSVLLNQKISSMFPNLVQIEQMNFVGYKDVGSSNALIIEDLFELQYLRRFRVDSSIPLTAIGANMASLMGNPEALVTHLSSLIEAQGAPLEAALGEICYRNVKRLEGNKNELFARVYNAPQKMEQ